MRLIVVRHGQAEPKKGWSGPDADRPLVARGRRQANRLSLGIGAGAIDRVLSSPAVRCHDTVEPIAKEWALPVEVSPMLSLDAGADVSEWVRDLIGRESGTLLLCTHREVISALLPALTEGRREALGHRLPGAKGGAWVMGFRGGRLRSVEYRPPAA